MSDNPPCDCIEKMRDGKWTWICACSNSGDAENAAYWCATANAKTEVEQLKAENAELTKAANRHLERVVELTAENAKLRSALERISSYVDSFVRDFAKEPRQ